MHECGNWGGQKVGEIRRLQNAPKVHRLRFLSNRHKIYLLNIFIIQTLEDRIMHSRPCSRNKDNVVGG